MTTMMFYAQKPYEINKQKPHYFRKLTYSKPYADAMDKLSKM